MSDGFKHEYGAGLEAWRKYQARGIASDGLTLGPTRNCPNDESSRIEAALEREATIPGITAAAYEVCRKLVHACLRPMDNVIFVQNRIRELTPIDAEASLNSMLIDATERIRKDFVEAMVTISLAIAARGDHVETDERGQAVGVVEAIDRLLVAARMQGAEEEREECAKECDAVNDDAEIGRAHV